MKKLAPAVLLAMPIALIGAPAFAAETTSVAPSDASTNVVLAMDTADNGTHTLSFQRVHAADDAQKEASDVPEIIKFKEGVAPTITLTHGDVVDIINDDNGNGLYGDGDEAPVNIVSGSKVSVSIPQGALDKFDSKKTPFTFDQKTLGKDVKGEYEILEDIPLDNSGTSTPAPSSDDASPTPVESAEPSQNDDALVLKGDDDSTSHQGQRMLGMAAAFQAPVVREQPAAAVHAQQAPAVREQQAVSPKVAAPVQVSEEWNNSGSSRSSSGESSSSSSRSDGGTKYAKQSQSSKSSTSENESTSRSNLEGADKELRQATPDNSSSTRGDVQDGEDLVVKKEVKDSGSKSSSNSERNAKTSPKGEKSSAVQADAPQSAEDLADTGASMATLMGGVATLALGVGLIFVFNRKAQARNN